jgi:2-hydroxy-3-keto-5-methylthiopentenyl-1-phosphate phosphatase
VRVGEPRNLLVTDFDGTLTEFDFYEKALEHVDQRDMPDYWSQYSAGKITHFEAMKGIFSHIRCSRDEVEGIMDSLNIEPDLSVCLETLSESGWKVAIVSAGSRWYIDRILNKLGISQDTVEIHASPGEFSPERGLVLSLPEGSPYCSKSHGIDKVRIVEEGLTRYDRVAFAGNGPPDLQPSLKVQPELRFARQWLADALKLRGDGFHPFERWKEVAERLTS